MKLTIARAVMAVAGRCMGRHRHQWTQAMHVEFDAAADAGEPLSFALGCLLAAGRELPAHEEGRFAIASHILALGVLVPVAALLLFGVAAGQPFIVSDGASLPGSWVAGAPAIAINDGNLAGVPLLTALTSILGIGHLYVAWALLDRRFTRIVVAGRVAAAMTITSATFSGLLFLQIDQSIPQAVAVAIELVSMWTLVRWRDELFDHDTDDPETSFS